MNDLVSGSLVTVYRELESRVRKAQEAGDSLKHHRLLSLIVDLKQEFPELEDLLESDSWGAFS